ncbi:hypothetical protein L9F63_014685, partial [Diploptera punctata]
MRVLFMSFATLFLMFGGILFSLEWRSVFQDFFLHNICRVRKVSWHYYSKSNTGRAEYLMFDGVKNCIRRCFVIVMDVSLFNVVRQGLNVTGSERHIVLLDGGLFYTGKYEIT